MHLEINTRLVFVMGETEGVVHDVRKDRIQSNFTDPGISTLVDHLALHWYHTHCQADFIFLGSYVTNFINLLKGTDIVNDTVQINDKIS